MGRVLLLGLLFSAPALAEQPAVSAAPLVESCAVAVDLHDEDLHDEGADDDSEEDADAAAAMQLADEDETHEATVTYPAPEPVEFAHARADARPVDSVKDRRLRPPRL